MARGLFRPGFAIWRPAETFSGGVVTTAPALSSTVAGRATPLSGGEAMRAEQQRGVIAWRFSTSAATDVQEGDEVRFSGRALRVLTINLTSTGLRKECACEEVRR